MEYTEEITHEDVSYKLKIIRDNLGIANKQIAVRIHVMPSRLNLWVLGFERISESKYEEICKIADFAMYRSDYHRNLRNRDDSVELERRTENYIDKQIRMKKYIMGESILRFLAESPKTIHELQNILRNNHRQAVSRKIQEMENYKIVTCERWLGHFVKCRLRPGVKTYLFQVHWRKNVRYVERTPSISHTD
jgi:hypothetical protein